MYDPFGGNCLEMCEMRASPISETRNRKRVICKITQMRFLSQFVQSSPREFRQVVEVGKVEKVPLGFFVFKSVKKSMSRKGFVQAKIASDAQEKGLKENEFFKPCSFFFIQISPLTATPRLQ